MCVLDCFLIGDFLVGDPPPVIFFGVYYVYVEELENSFKIRMCINKIYNNYSYVTTLFNFKNNSINI